MTVDQRGAAPATGELVPDPLEGGSVVKPTSYYYSIKEYYKMKSTCFIVFVTFIINILLKIFLMFEDTIGLKCNNFETII